MSQTISNLQFSFVTTLRTDVGGDFADQLYLIRTYNIRKKIHTSSHPSRAPTGFSANPNSRTSTSLPGTAAARDATDESHGGTIGPTIAHRGTTKTGMSIGPNSMKMSLSRRINYETAQKFEIWKVARAATAVVLYFKPVTIRDEQRQFLLTDAGLGQEINPTQEGLLEIQDLEGSGSVNTVVSIGTARKDQEKKKNLIGMTKRWVDMLADPEQINKQVEKTAAREDFPFFRLNDPQALDVALDEWKPRNLTSWLNRKESGHKTIEKIEGEWNRWAAEPDNQDLLQKCARMLVQHRRTRAESYARWERFATCVRYECKNCSDLTVRNRELFEKHVKDCHEYDPSRLDIELDRHREVWRYPPRPGS